MGSYIIKLIDTNYADSPKISPIYVVREILDFRFRLATCHGGLVDLWLDRRWFKSRLGHGSGR